LDDTTQDESCQVSYTTDACESM